MLKDVVRETAEKRTASDENIVREARHVNGKIAVLSVPSTRSFLKTHETLKSSQHISAFLENVWLSSSTEIRKIVNFRENFIEFANICSLLTKS